MPYAITQSCCADAACVAVCPVDCIHPMPGEPGFDTADALHIDPQTCIDCGACRDACPVDAPTPIELLRGPARRFAQIDADYYAGRAPTGVAPPLTSARRTGLREPLRVAIVGTGPAASYAARALLTGSEAGITMLDRSRTLGGLLHHGVAADHLATRGMLDTFRWIHQHPRLRLRLGTEVGVDVTHEQLLQEHHAVIYGTGATDNPPLGIPGESTPGVVTAAALMRWFVTGEGADPVPAGLSRAVVVGNGNVALDVARLLLATDDVLARSDLHVSARESLRRSRVREVVVLGRRDPNHAAFTRPELLMLPATLDARVVVADGRGVRDALTQVARPHLEVLRDLPVVDVDLAAPPASGRRLVLGFSTTVDCVEGTDTMSALQLTKHGLHARGPAQMLVRANGFRVRPVDGLPYDEAAGRIPQTDGRVHDAAGTALPGTYLVGWARRGATGGIGASRHDAEEVVRVLLDDAHAGRLPTPPSRPSRRGAMTVLRGRGAPSRRPG